MGYRFNKDRENSKRTSVKNSNPNLGRSESESLKSNFDPLAMNQIITLPGEINPF